MELNNNNNNINFNIIIKILLITIITAQNEITANAQNAVVESILPGDYDSRLQPRNDAPDEPLNISVRMFINDLLDANEVQQNFQVDLILVQKWYDKRLNVSGIELEEYSLFDPNTIQRFWLPDFYFVNGITVSIVNALHSSQVLSVDRDALVSYSVRLNAKLTCYMDLQEYPHDYQYCTIKMSSLIYNSSNIRFIWEELKVSDIEYVKFKISTWSSGYCAETDTIMPENSCIVTTLKMVRRLSYYIIRYYLLTALCVLISFCGFWIPTNGWPARVAIVVTPLLSLVTMDIAMNNEISVSYVVSMNWWFMWIQAIMYLELVQYAFAIAWAHFIIDKREYAKNMEQKQIHNRISAISPMPDGLPGYYFGNNNWYSKCGTFFDRFVRLFFGNVPLTLEPYTRNKVDYVARIVFPAVFALFVLIYSLVAFAPWSANFYNN